MRRMKDFKKVLIATLCCLLIVACLPLSSQEKARRVNCQAACQCKAKLCAKTCRNNCQQCCAYSTHTTKKMYLRYKQEVCVKGDFLTLQLNSFRDPLQCRKTTCDCQMDFKVCMQACSGMVYKNLERVCP